MVLQAVTGTGTEKQKLTSKSCWTDRQMEGRTDRIPTASIGLALRTVVHKNQSIFDTE